MNYLIGLLAVVFFFLAVSVITKSVKLNNKLSGTEDDDSTVDNFNNANGIGMLIFWLLFVILGSWSFLNAKPDFLPLAASEHGVKTDNMFWISMAVVTFAFFVSNTLLFYFAYKYPK